MGINTQEEFNNPTLEDGVDRTDSAPISGKDGVIAQEVGAATPPQMGLPPVSEGVRPEDVPQPTDATLAPSETAPETVPPTLASTAAMDTENPSAVAQEVATQSTPDIPAPQENTEAPTESSPQSDISSTPEALVPEKPSPDGKSLDGVGAPNAEKINPHKMAPHDLEATVGLGDEKGDVKEEPTQPVPPPVPEDSNADISKLSETPNESSTSAEISPTSSELSTSPVAPQESVASPAIPEMITADQPAESETSTPETKENETEISILERIERRNKEQADDIDDLKRRMQSPETLNREAA